MAVNADTATNSKSNEQDVRDMERMGKIQKLKRNFTFSSIFGFSMILMQSWEAVVSVAVMGLTNGGTAGSIWTYFVCWIGFIFVNVSMAEMASMAPTSGGQYHWVSEFAPPECQKFLSYMMGWMCVLAWQTMCASTAYIAGTQIQGLLRLNYESYVPQMWHGTFLAIAVAAFSVLFNVYLASRLPVVEVGLLCIHILGFFAILVTLWVLAPRTPAAEVFTVFHDGGGWGTIVVSVMAGVTAGIVPLLGGDAAVHMAEELQDASTELPRALIATTLFNGALGLAMLVTFCFTLGDLDDVLNSPTSVPFIAVFYNATQSIRGATVMSVLIILMTVAANLTTVTTTSRQLWAFSRDKGMPLSSWFSHVDPGSDLPIRSLTMTLIVTVLLSLIAIGSPVALNSITSLGTGAILSSYICSISCILWRRFGTQPLPAKKFSLGRSGPVVNIISILFLITAFIFAFFPPMPMPTGDQMNWSILIYGATGILSLVYYEIWAKDSYHGPVSHISKSV